MNNELNNVYDWLCANQFHHPQRRLNSNFKLTISNEFMRRDYCIRYLGIYIDGNLNWKSHIGYVAKKIKRSVGILSRLHYYVGEEILVNLYYALIYLFILYGVIAWGCTYESNLQPLYILQKKALQIMTFSKFDEHSNPLFKQLEIIKIFDLITFRIAVFMMKFYNQLLPEL